MLVAALLARLARLTDREDFADAPAPRLDYTVSRQRADGSWLYGERSDLSWIDGFHTGYVLGLPAHLHRSADRRLCGCAGVAARPPLLRGCVDRARRHAKVHTAIALSDRRPMRGAGNPYARTSDPARAGHRRTSVGSASLCSRTPPARRRSICDAAPPLAAKSDSLPSLGASSHARRAYATDRYAPAGSRMHQVTQRLRNGRIEVLDVPPAVVAPTGVLVDVRASLVSAGTERSTVDAARRSLVGKARARPDQARAALEKARRDGIRPTLDAVRLRLDQPSALGYSSAGVVLVAGELATRLRPGDRVACAGGGYAVHAEVNSVPANLCTKLPDQVSFDAGAFVTVGSIALHGVRQADAHIGERVAVVGLGLVGQITCRILSACGCEVIGVDLVAELVDRARRSGIARAFLRSQLDVRRMPVDAGQCDAVILTASTKSDDPIALAGALARDRARVVVLGDVGMTLPRTSYYGKELEVRLSRSYGPGRYDRAYEERGLDYPIGYVRWTEQRNLAAFAALLGDGRVSVDDLITVRVPVAEAPAAYDRLVNGSASPLGLLLTYEASPVPAPAVETRTVSPRRPTATPTVGVIGAGSFSQRVLIPGLREAGFGLSAVSSANGLSAAAAAERFGFGRTASPEEVIQADDLNLVCIASTHASHARYAVEALQRGCAVFVEKPPALSLRRARCPRRRCARPRSSGGLQPSLRSLGAQHAPTRRRTRPAHRAPLPCCRGTASRGPLAERSRGGRRTSPWGGLPLRRLRVLAHGCTADTGDRKRCRPTRGSLSGTAILGDA